jgi:hypothetical protein
MVPPMPKTQKELIVFLCLLVAFLLAAGFLVGVPGCSQENERTEPGQGDTVECDISCEIFDQCFGFVSQKDRSECYDLCENVSVQDSDCMRICNRNEYCDPWLLCIEGC